MGTGLGLLLRYNASLDGCPFVKIFRLFRLDGVITEVHLHVNTRK
jgi:hypothetical protein